MVRSWTTSKLSKKVISFLGEGGGGAIGVSNIGIKDIKTSMSRKNAFNIGYSSWKLSIIGNRKVMRYRIIGIIRDKYGNIGMKNPPPKMIWLDYITGEQECLQWIELYIPTNPDRKCGEENRVDTLANKQTN